MFSQVSVILFIRGMPGPRSLLGGVSYVQGAGIPVGRYTRGAGYTRGGGYTRGVRYTREQGVMWVYHEAGTRGGRYTIGWRWVYQRVGVGWMGMYTYPLPRHVTLDTHLPVLIPSGSHHNMYSWQGGGTRPTGMISSSSVLSLLHYISCSQKRSSTNTFVLVSAQI